MISVENIQTFKRFNGDIDGWARTKQPSDTMTYKAWFEIESTLQNLALVKGGLASESFKTQTLEQLKSMGTSDEAIEALIDLSEKQ